MAEIGHPVAAYNYALELQNRSGQQDKQERQRQREEVEYWYGVAADGGLFIALETVGLDAKTDRQRAWLGEAIKQGSALGAKRMGDYFASQENDLEKVAFWYARAVSMSLKKAKEGKTQRDLFDRVEYHPTGLRIKKLYGRSSMANLSEIHQGAYDLAMLHLQDKLAGSDRMRAENYFQFAGTLPVYDSGIITAIREANEARGGGGAQHHRKKMGFQTLQYMRFWDHSDKELTRYPSAFINAIERGDLRAVTVLDYYDWQRQNNRIDQGKLAKIMSSYPSSRQEREHIEIFVPIVRDINLPDISDMPNALVTLINTSSEPKPDWIKLGYEVLNIGLDT